MARVKVRSHISQNIIYTNEKWENLKNLRKKAITVMDIMRVEGFNCLAYGSLARGDIHKNSDIDIILKERLASYRIELIIDRMPFRLIKKSLIQATPNDVIKVHYHLEEDITISLLLTDFTSHAFEFYRFGGMVSLSDLEKNIRVAGIDKRLVLILPNDQGHYEKSVLDHPYEARKYLHISQAIIDQRIRVLSERDKKGRTGVFLHEDLHPDQNVELRLRELARENPLIRRRINQ